ncbi:hypothetical protein KR054_005746 [Drosophila jambulina]|nr:hypothetical protein KR054_005746 [Drosophila jambulina]
MESVPISTPKSKRNYELSFKYQQNSTFIYLPTATIALGTDPGAIASRLETFYGNLHASSPREVKATFQNKSFQWRLPNESRGARGLDINNNMCSPPEPKIPEQAEHQPKIKYELPQDYQGTKSCICLRPPRTYECGLCHHYLQGRLSQICEKHPSEAFLMDMRECPYCMAPLNMIKESPLSWEDIRKIEDADLPSDTDI